MWTRAGPSARGVPAGHDRGVQDDARGDSDFLQQMYLATLEESPLHEVPEGSLDHRGQGPAVQHGPWQPSRCAAVLRAWHAAGWVELYFPELPPTWNLIPADWQSRLMPGDFRALNHADAQTLLASPERWRLERADGQVCLSQSARGEAQSPSEWYALARLTGADSTEGGAGVI